ncbi:Protein of unknown function [Clostridium cavendishii DSM 21758]|uniref:DUF1659 domain-containing protein n=1 Tax=Clostridium cavendishii DSM 21758 TaxID=1121302 RepID=A0A1M6J305_9CLOT|nr:DUF1659 domain-containing protein [Clostridium cavendishii]SHJ41068.1 Protein of unknown function [Clostridium cavendishii DSM 21758]
MAVSAVPVKVSMLVKYQNGVDGKGKPKFKSQKLSKLNFALTDEDFSLVSKEITKLIDSQNVTVQKEQILVIA